MPRCPTRCDGLPIAVANVPSAIQAVPREHGKPQKEITYPSTEESEASAASSSPLQKPTAQRIDDGWREPETLLEGLRGLTVMGPTSKWATEVIRWIKKLGPTMAGGSDESVAILETLAKLDCQVPELAKTIQDRTLARRLRKVGYALGRRLDVWQEVVRLGVAPSVRRLAGKKSAKTRRVPDEPRFTDGGIRMKVRRGAITCWSMCCGKPPSGRRRPTIR